MFLCNARLYDSLSQSRGNAATCARLRNYCVPGMRRFTVAFRGSRDRRTRNRATLPRAKGRVSSGAPCLVRQAALVHVHRLGLSTAATDGGADSQDFLTKVQVFSSNWLPCRVTVLGATFARFPRFPAEDRKRATLPGLSHPVPLEAF